jgi:hypothetical protein
LKGGENSQVPFLFIEQQQQEQAYKEPCVKKIIAQCGMIFEKSKIKADAKCGIDKQPHKPGEK